VLRDVTPTHNNISTQKFNKLSLAGIFEQHLGTFLDWYWGTEEERYSGKCFFPLFFLSFN
jgi:hypothetical protein